MATDNIARGLALQGAPHPGFVSGNWYSLCPNASIAAGVAQVASTIRLVPFLLTKALRVTDLAARVTTLSASGNFQIAVYANNSATGKPTGAALCSTANLSTGATGPISGSVTPATLSPGLYWLAINQDNSVVAYQAFGNGTNGDGHLIGSATLANVATNTGNTLSLTVAQAFGTWPDLTSASFAESTANQLSAVGFAKAA